MAQAYWLVLGFAQRNTIPEESGKTNKGGTSGQGLDGLFAELNARQAGRL
jgi:hypothetical protein